MYLIFGIKLLFTIDIKLYFLEENIKRYCKKCLEVGNNQVKCDNFHFISDACMWRWQTNYMCSKNRK